MTKKKDKEQTVDEQREEFFAHEQKGYDARMKQAEETVESVEVKLEENPDPTADSDKDSEGDKKND